MSSYEHVWMMIGLNFQMNKDAIALISLLSGREYQISLSQHIQFVYPISS